MEKSLDRLEVVNLEGKGRKTGRQIETQCLLRSKDVYGMWS